MNNGKVIISGEHSVVYGELALAASVGLGVVARVVDKNGSEKTVVVEKAIEVAGGDKDLQVLIESQIPVGSGMGSSAAVAAAVINAVRQDMGKPIVGNDELYELVMKCEKIAHGNPSGIDAATVVYGGVVAFTKETPIEKLRIVKPIEVLLINTGEPVESTKEMVELVVKNSKKDEIIASIGVLTKEIKTKLIDGNRFDELLNQNGLLLEELGVVGDLARELTRKLRNLGACVKVTGAGGVKGGSGMLLITALDFTKIMKEIKKLGLDYIKTRLGEL